jgi:hypothetical protein
MRVIASVIPASCRRRAGHESGNPVHSATLSRYLRPPPHVVASASTSSITADDCRPCAATIRQTANVII